MTILKKRKGLLYLIIAIAIMVLAIACGDKPTQTSDFAEIDNNLPWSTNTTESGDTFTAKNIADASADSPVIVISGNNLILAYGKNDKVYYRSSHDLGETLTTETEFGTEHEDRNTPSTKKYPHIFFNGDNVIAVATASGRVATLEKPLVYITGTFKISDNGAGYINFKKWGTIGVINFEGQSGTAGSGLQAERYFGKETTIQTAAGVGRIVNGKYLLPISETAGTKYLKLEAKQYNNDEFGSVWDLNDTSGTKTANEIVKLDENGNKLNEGIVEKAGSYSIAANGTITGITGSPQVGNGTTEASIAEDGKGTIYTFTKEANGLVFRKFANTISGAIK